MAAMDHFQKKRRRSAMEIPLPKETIQRIQHFLNAKEAAQTTVLSKSWCSAWSTRPDLDLDQRYFSYRIEIFSEFANKNFKRYEDLNLQIQSFKLLMDSTWYFRPNKYQLSLAAQLIVKAIKLGAIDFEIGFSRSWFIPFVLPHDLLLSQTLARLSVSDFIVDLRRNHGEDRFANLKSLILTRVRVKGDLIRDLNSRWPLIEELTLDLDRPLKLGELREVGLLRKLRYLCLRNVMYVKDILSGGWENFPCLRELVICGGESYRDLLQICSRSLECIRIRLLDDDSIWNVEFDVPNIRIFEYEGSSRFPGSSSRQQNASGSRITWSPDRLYPDLLLNRLVEMLSSSRVSLSLTVRMGRFGCWYGRHNLAEAVALENLALQGEAVSLCFVENIILSCRPKFVYIEEENAKLFEDLKVQPWLTVLDNAASIMYKEKKKFAGFQLNSIS